jgi:hypothetical protein
MKDKLILGKSLSKEYVKFLELPKYILAVILTKTFEITSISFKKEKWNTLILESNTGKSTISFSLTSIFSKINLNKKPIPKEKIEINT